MQNLQEVYDELQENKKNQKEIRREYKDLLKNADDYEELGEKIKKFREEKKQIEITAQARMGARWDELEKLKYVSEELTQKISDIAMSDLVSGKTVVVKDKQNNDFEPVYKITFKRVE